YDIHLDEQHAAKLEALAVRMHVQPGLLARWLLSDAIDQADPDASMIVQLLDAIPGAFDRHEKGRADARAGRTIRI
ncbi:MAG TPA: hypothetical protein VK858_08355, partial [Longimicrobiales bacterium]|nr:hypothetical protein [Longimicrobiales bacterium]